jgi:peptide deformylase
MILDILQQPDPILKEKALKVSRLTPELKDFIVNMVETLYAKNGVGLAAPQVGRSIQIIVFDETPERHAPKVLINPKITGHSTKKTSGIEGCLSCRGIEMEVNRYQTIKVQGKDLAFEDIAFEAKGFMARIIQHEVDHLNGITIIESGHPVPPELKGKVQGIIE